MNSIKFLGSPNPHLNFTPPPPLPHSLSCPIYSTHDQGFR